jgi:hypothetical protein
MKNKSLTMAPRLQSKVEQLCHSDQVSCTDDAGVALPEELHVGRNPDGDLKSWWITQAQLVVNPPIDVAQFVKFLRLTRESLHFRIMQTAGSNEAGCSLAIYSDKPVLLTALLARLGQICRVEAITNGAWAEERYPDTIKKLIAIQGLEKDQNMAIFVNLSEN